MFTATSSDWELDIGVSLDTLKKPERVFLGGGDPAP